MTSIRLPRTVVPRRYQIRIEPDLTAGTFAGDETIEVTVGEPTAEVVLNAADLTIATAEIDDGAGRRLTATIRVDEAAERVLLRFVEPLQPGPWRLALRFSGILNDKLRGFYRSRFTAGDGRAAILAVTQFEATDARRAFPCWDEPAFKAVFQVTLVVDEALAAVSNTAMASVRRMPERGKKEVTFAPTIPMSTYLLAFVIGPLEPTDAVQADGIPIRVWAVPGKGHLGSFALEVAAFSLRFFREYFAVDYPGDKLDLIAIPDFAFGAMENLGAITFRETALLADQGSATHAELARVAHVVAHEIAHMWFGDLVTMAWWNGLWLNEAFATFMEVLAVDAWKPAWGRWDNFGVSRTAAFLTDGLRSSRPIEFEVVAPKDAEAMFDVLTYEKGGAVLRMLEQYLGPEVFRDGVRKYLTAHQFSNAETTDLWKALGIASGQPIPEMMDGWIFRQGFPLVTVEAEGTGEIVRFSQHSVPISGRWRRHEIPLAGSDHLSRSGERQHRARPHPSLDRGRARHLSGQAGLARGERGGPRFLPCALRAGTPRTAPPRTRRNAGSHRAFQLGQRRLGGDRGGHVSGGRLLGVDGPVPARSRPARVDLAPGVVRVSRTGRPDRSSVRPGSAGPRSAGRSHAARRLVFEGRRERP